MIIYYSGSAGVMAIEPEALLKGKGSVMLTYAELRDNSHSQVKRLEIMRKVRKRQRKKAKQ